ncbi:hypothetical protein [Pelagibaculum spongiae]|uniref:Receptor L-domain domain-containing protein n=1 Tax=Pelagibaculum spongiae TaxID=2080658 RepID=A0A2V1GXJ6_9GAMM|nr:hypothetical protein [Pelagibaculum spongiae]PVZ66364.1 hypothetical protein DC094_16840 [Pelagibaculum spongiae]
MNVKFAAYGCLIVSTFCFGQNSTNSNNFNSAEIKNTSVDVASLFGDDNYLEVEELPKVYSVINSKCPIDTDYLLINQNEIDNFYNKNRCTQIQGSLFIGTFRDLTVESDIFNLKGLGLITSVRDNLYIKVLNLVEDINPLSSIKYVGGDIQVFGNEHLTNIDGLSNINALHGEIIVGYNVSLVDLNGLKNIKSVDSDISIIGNHALNNLNGLSGISKIGGSLLIQGNLALTSLDGIDNISANQGVSILKNPALESLNGLNINQIEEHPSEYIYINDNRILTECSNACPLIEDANTQYMLIISGNSGSCRNASTLLSTCSE